MGCIHGNQNRHSEEHRNRKKQNDGLHRLLRSGVKLTLIANEDAKFSAPGLLSVVKGEQLQLVDILDEDWIKAKNLRQETGIVQLNSVEIKVCGSTRNQTRNPPELVQRRGLETYQIENVGRVANSVPHSGTEFPPYQNQFTPNLEPNQMYECATESVYANEHRQEEIYANGKMPEKQYANYGRI